MFSHLSRSLFLLSIWMLTASVQPSSDKTTHMLANLFSDRVAQAFPIPASLKSL